MFLLFFFFFFSSRRRHTRCLSDWSSDVCSSDLPDIVSAGPSRLIVLPGRGDGTFEEDLDFFAGIPVVDVAVADLNGDGHLDVAGAARGGVFCSICPDVPGDVEIFLGRGDGTLGPRT